MRETAVGSRRAIEEETVVKLSAEVAPIGCTRDSCVCFREERAEIKAGKATEKRRVSSRDLLDEQWLGSERANEGGDSVESAG